MTEWPKISIVTPSFNQGQFLEETIISVLSQDYPNLEYMIIDGGSTDNSVVIITKYSDQLMYWVSEGDQGQADALNKGFRRISGDIVGWINSDDIYVDKCLFTIADAFIKHPESDLIYGNYYNIDETGKVTQICHDLPHVPSLCKLGGLFFCQPASFFKRSVLSRVGYIDNNLHYCMDNDFYYRMLKKGCKFKHIKNFIAKFRYHSSSKTVAFKRQMEREAYENWVNYYGLGNELLNRYIYSFCLYTFRFTRHLNNSLRNTCLCIRNIKD